ncbi:DUF4395 domain-containing protein [Viscerimonas tarda]
MTNKQSWNVILNKITEDPDYMYDEKIIDETIQNALYLAKNFAKGIGLSLLATIVLGAINGWLVLIGLAAIGFCTYQVVNNLSNLKHAKTARKLIDKKRQGTNYTNK